MENGRLRLDEQQMLRNINILAFSPSWLIVASCMRRSGHCPRPLLSRCWCGWSWSSSFSSIQSPSKVFSFSRSTTCILLCQLGGYAPLYALWDSSPWDRLHLSEVGFAGVLMGVDGGGW